MTITFAASADHATAKVSGYVLEIRQPGIATIASFDLKKPTPSGGNISFILDPYLRTLPSGAYSARVAVYGPDGRATGLASTNFDWTSQITNPTSSGTPSTFGQQEGSPLTRGEHPRAGITAALLPQLRSDIAAYRLPQYQEFVDYLNNHLPFAETDNGTDTKWNVLNYAFAYNMGTIPGINYGSGSSAAYGDAAVKIIRYRTQTSPVTLQTVTFCAIALAADWVWNLMTQTDKDAVLAICVSNTVGSFPFGLPVNDQPRAGQASILLAALLAYGEAVDQNIVNTRLAWYGIKNEPNTYGLIWSRKGSLEIEAYAAGTDGGAIQGFNYTHHGQWSDILPHVLCAKAFQTAYGKTVVQEFTEATSLWTEAMWQYYTLHQESTSDMVRAIRQFYAESPQQYNHTAIQMLGATRHYIDISPTNASLAQWMLDNYAKFRSEGSITDTKQESLVKHFLFFGNPVSQSPTQLNLPVSKHFDRYGMVVMKGSHTDVNATQVMHWSRTYGCSPGIYTPKNAGDIVVLHRGPLLIKSGAGTHHAYGNRTVSSNCMVFVGPTAGDEDGQGGISTYEFDAFVSWEQLVDPGGTPVNYRIKRNWKRVDVCTEVVPTNHPYDYVYSNDTRQYSNTGSNGQIPGGASIKISRCSRHFAWFRGAPDRMFVYDRAVTIDTIYEKRLCWHPSGCGDAIPNNMVKNFTLTGFSGPTPGPSRNGSTAGKETYTGNGYITIRNDNNSGGMNGGGQLYLQTLWPTSKITVLVGGPNSDGKWYCTTNEDILDSHEYENSWGEQEVIPGAHEPIADNVWQSGMYRFEIIPSTPQLADEFLHTLEVTDIVGGASRTAPVAISGTNFKGGILGDCLFVAGTCASITHTPDTDEGRLNSGNFVVPTIGTYRYIIADLLANTDYTVEGTSKTSSSAGIIYGSLTTTSTNQTIDVSLS